MAVYTYLSYNEKHKSKSPDCEPNPMHVWFDPTAQVYHATQDYGDNRVAMTHKLGEKTLSDLYRAVDWDMVPNHIHELLVSDSANLRERQARDQTDNQNSPLVLMMAINEENTHKSLCLYETADAKQNIEVNFDIATGMFDIQESRSSTKTGYYSLYTQGISPKFGTSSAQEVREMLNTLGEIPPEINTWIDDMSNRYPHFEKREDPELERYRIINVMLEKHGQWLNKQEGGEQASFADRDISGDHFRGRNLEKVDFTRCDMSKITGENIDFSKAIMPNTNWQGMKMRNMRFDRVNLHGANFKETVLENVNFSGDLQNTDFTASTLVNCGFNGNVEIDGITLVDSENSGSRMQNVTMKDALIVGTSFSNIPNDKFTLSNAKLTDCRINDSDMFQWELTNTTIQAVIDLPSFATLNKNNQAKEIDLSFQTGSVLAKNASIINVPIKETGATAYIAFLPDQNAFIGAIKLGNSCGDLFEDRGYYDNGPYEKVKFMRSPEAVERGINEANGDNLAVICSVEIPEHLMVKMQRLLDENTKRLASNNTLIEPEHTEENSQRR